MLDGARPPWSDYQESVANFFRSLGLSATTNAAVTGVRTSHDVDVYVEASFAGLEMVWLVECKHWKRRVTKSHVLALRTIVQEVGADRGIMMAENGYQAGAIEAAAGTNITLTSLAELRTSTSSYVAAYRLDSLARRLDECHQRLRALHITTHRSSNSTRSRSLSGAGSTILLYGTLGAAEDGLQKARLGRLPASYGFSSDGESYLVADTMDDLMEALEQIAVQLGDELTAREERVRRGPDAHLWSERRP